MLFIGDKVEYDLKSRSGVLYEGKTQSGSFYISGEKIYFQPNGQCLIENAKLTTCEDKDPSWHLKAHSMTIAPDSLMRAKDLTFKIVKMPVMWLPRMRANLDTLPKNPFDFQAAWKSEAGPRLTLKYQIYSWKHARIDTRFDFRFKRGPGFGIESFYQKEETVVKTRSYVTRDRTILNQKNKARYRIEGLAHHTTPDDKVLFSLSYDKLSDPQMPYDYPRDTFALPLPKPTRLALAARTSSMLFFTIEDRVKINFFETMKESLPAARFTVAPMALSRFGFMGSLPLEISYLDYRFARQWRSELNDFGSMRFLAKPKLTYTLPTLPLKSSVTLEPIYLFYGSAISGRSQSFSLLRSSANASFPLLKAFNKSSHLIAPFARVEHYTRPSRPLDEHLIFDTEDAYLKLTKAKIGLSNQFVSLAKPGVRMLSVDLYVLGLWHTRAWENNWPKLGLDLDWQKPYLNARAHTLWNREKKEIEAFNIGCEWTFSQDVALSTEFRHRSKYSFRKADPSRFFIEADKTLDDLLASPLSDQRNTVLFDLAYRLSPTWRLHLESRHGWHRSDEKAFNDYRIEVSKFLSCNLNIAVYVQHTEANTFKGGLKLSVNKKPHQPRLKVRGLRPKW